MFQQGAPGTSLRVVEELADLSAIFEDDVNIVIHPRRLAARLARDASELAQQPGFGVSLRVPPGDGGLPRLRAGLEDAPALAEDVADLATLLADLTDAADIGVRLARLDAAMCPRLHVDRVPLRLVCTYLGPGTEVVPGEEVDRSRLGHASKGLPDERSGLLRGGARVRHAVAGDVVLLKGELWPGNGGRGAVHRSPAVPAGERRLVLTLDVLG